MTDTSVNEAACFYVMRNGGRTGPFDIQQVRKLLNGKLMSPDSLVWKEGMTDWTKACAVPEIAAVLTKMPPAIPA